MSKRAAIYCRISRDAEQEGLGVARQEEDCRALVAREGWTLVEPPYVDNDISASTLSKKARPAYDAMLAAARDGGVDVIVAYANSRLTRRPLELEDLITLHEQHGTLLHTVASGDDDLSTASGRMVARIKASVDAHEAEVTAERLRRAFLQKAQRGAPNQGTRPFGWGDDKVALHPKEATLLRRAIQDVIDGVPTREVARRWNAAGVTTTRGKAWNHTAVRQVLRNPRLAGWRTHQKQVARDASGERVRGVWAPMVDQATFDALQAALDGRRPRARVGGQRYLLSGIARCGVCGGGMHGYRTSRGAHAYACGSEGLGHSVTVAGVQTDALIAALVERRLADVDLAEEPVAAAEWEGEARLRAIPGQVAELMAAFNSGVLSGAVTFPQVQALEAEQAALEKARPKAPPRPVVATADAFPALDVDRQRAVVDTLVQAVVVAKAPHRGARWTPDRVEVVWR
ncbi:recombinase family protein [Nocardioides panacihumi]|uniref:Recombinase family protein n=1 Tax=Nocardioides panacihumi TaxID=400774 RepID=A0ABN2R3V7_9ACTN